MEYLREISCTVGKPAYLEYESSDSYSSESSDEEVSGDKKWSVVCLCERITTYVLIPCAHVWKMCRTF